MPLRPFSTAFTGLSRNRNSEKRNGRRVLDQGMETIMTNGTKYSVESF